MRFGLGPALIVLLVIVAQFQNHGHFTQSRSTLAATDLASRQRLLGQRIEYISQRPLLDPSPELTEVTEALGMFRASYARLAQWPALPQDAAARLRQGQGPMAHFNHTAGQLLKRRPVASQVALAGQIKDQERHLGAYLTQLVSTLSGAILDSVIRQDRLHQHFLFAVVMIVLAEMVLIFLPAQPAVGSALRKLAHRSQRQVIRQTLRRKTNADLSNQMMHDPVTGLPNHMAAIHLLTAALISHRDGLSVLRINVDPTKLEGAGTTPATQMTVPGRIAIFQDEVCDGDQMASIDATDIVVITHNDPGATAERLARALLMPLSVGLRPASNCCHIGYTSATLDGTAADLLDEAGRSLVMARQNGPGSIVAYTAAIRQADTLTNQLIAALPEAITAGQITAHFQPQVCLADGTTVGLDVLARWQHPDLGPLSAQRFVPLVVSAGCDRALDVPMVSLHPDLSMA